MYLEKKSFWAVFIGSILIAVVLGDLMIANFNYNRGYIDACKDFYKGNIKYDLKELDDGTRIWIKK